MAKFRGDKNLHLGGVEPWAASTYDHTTRTYVIDLDAAGAKKFRSIAADYGFVEDKSSSDD